MDGKKAYNPNSNSARPAATTTTCRPSTVNEIGAALVFPPSELRQASRPVSASNAKTTPPDAPNTNPPSVERRPLFPFSESTPDGAGYSHFRAPVAASSATTLRVVDSSWLQPLPTNGRFATRVIWAFGGSFVKTELLSVAGMKMYPRFSSKAGFCQFVPPELPGLTRRP